MTMIEVFHPDNGESIRICACDAESMASIGWLPANTIIEPVIEDTDIEEIA